MKLKDFFEALYHLLLFKEYINFNRTFEVTCSVLAWIGVYLISTSIYKAFTS